MLRAFPGRWTPTREETRYRWLRDGADIAGAVSRSYRLEPADRGRRISVRVTATRSGAGDLTIAWALACAPTTRAARKPIARIS
mgnify:CR=1 FL=1